MMPGVTFQEIRDAIIDAYTPQSLEETLLFQMNERLDDITLAADFGHRVFLLLKWAEKNGREVELVQAMAKERPRNAKMQEIYKKYGMAIAVCVENAGARVPNAPTDGADSGLEKIVRLIGEAVGALKAVPDLLKEHEVRVQFAPFTSAYQEAAVHIGLLRRYKTLHDCLHTIQLQYREIAGSAQRIAEGDRVRGEIASYADGLESAAEKCGYVDGKQWGEPLSGLRNPGPEKTWLQKLRQIVDELRATADSAHDGSAAKKADNAVDSLDKILASNPIRLHGLIVTEFNVIPLPALVHSLQGIQNTPTAPAVRARLADGLTALEALHRQLVRLIAEHGTWQNLDNSLRAALVSWHEFLAVDRRRTAERRVVAVGAGGSRVEEEDSTTDRDLTLKDPVGAGGSRVEKEDSQTVYANRLLEDWRDVAEKFAEVRTRVVQGRRLDRLTEYAEALATAADARDFGTVFDAFEPFAKLALLRFIDVDKELLRLADDLKLIGEPIQAILEVMRS